MPLICMNHTYWFTLVHGHEPSLNLDWFHEWFMKNVLFDLLCGPLVVTHFWCVFLVHQSNGTYFKFCFVAVSFFRLKLWEIVILCVFSCSTRHSLK